MNTDPSLETAYLILRVVSYISILGLIAMILVCLLRHWSACVKANLAKARAEIAADREARVTAKRAPAAQKATQERAIINEDGIASPPPQLLFEIRRARLRKLGIDEETDYYALVYGEEARCKREEIELQERERNEEHWRKSRLPYLLGSWWISFGALNIASEGFTGHYLYPWLAGAISFVIAFLVVALLETANLRKNH